MVFIVILFCSQYIHNDKMHLEVQWYPHLKVVNLCFSVFLIELLWSGPISLMLHLSCVISSKDTSDEDITVFFCVHACVHAEHYGEIVCHL
jgi:hypothetical protein